MFYFVALICHERKVFWIPVARGIRYRRAPRDNTFRIVKVRANIDICFLSYPTELQNIRKLSITCVRLFPIVFICPELSRMCAVGRITHNKTINPKNERAWHPGRYVSEIRDDDCERLAAVRWIKRPRLSWQRSNEDTLNVACWTRTFH